MEPAKKNTSRRRRLASAVSSWYIAASRILCQCERLPGSQSCCICVDRVFPQNEQQVKESSAAGSQGNHSCPPENSLLQASRGSWQNPRAPGISVTGYDPPITPVPRAARDPASMDPSRSGSALPVGASPPVEGPRCPECNRDVGSSRLVEEQPQAGLDERAPSLAESLPPDTVPSSPMGGREGEVGEPGTSGEKGEQEQSVPFSFRSMCEKLWDPPWPSLPSSTEDSTLQDSLDLLKYRVTNIPPRSESHEQTPEPPEETTPESSIPDSELLRVSRTDYEFWAAFNFGGTEAARMLLMERRERAAATKKASIS